VVYFYYFFLYVYLFLPSSFSFYFFRFFILSYFLFPMFPSSHPAFLSPFHTSSLSTRIERTYNERWLIRRHGHRTPGQVRRDLVSSKPAAA